LVTDLCDDQDLTHIKLNWL